jgi:hypothetical protein
MSPTKVPPASRTGRYHTGGGASRCTILSNRRASIPEIATLDFVGQITPLWRRSCRFPAKEAHMLWTILVVLLILWLLGFTTAAVGNLIHLLLVVALVVLILQLLSGRRGV